MAKKNSAGEGLIFVAALIIWILVSIPKEIWIAIIVVAVAIWGIRKYLQDKSLSQPVSKSDNGKLSGSPWTSSSKASSTKDSFITITFNREGDDVEFGIPAPPDDVPSNARWISPGEAVTVSGVTFQGGMVYVGTGLRGSYYDIEPALINPNLKVAAGAVDITLPLTSYWPSYTNISPEARRGYLQWLSDGRADPSANIGYVFLFFYGLERRALLDGRAEVEAKADIPRIEAEVRRLLGIYGQNSSFKRYAGNFLDFISSEKVDEKLYLKPAPAITEHLYSLPSSISVGLGQLAVDQKAVPADWALAWALADPYISKRTSVSRCVDLFGQLFKQRYTEVYGEGLRLKVNRTKLKVSYMPASGGLRSYNFTQPLGGLPDVSAVKGPTAKLQALVNECASELDPYSRYIGRNPDKAQALEGLLQLPATLWPAPVKAELGDLKARVGDGVVLMSFGELSGRLKSAGELSRDKVVGLARALESLHLGMEPDVLAGAKTPKSEDKIALFATHPEDGAIRSGPAYSAAAVTLDLACVAALADGEASAHELLHITKHVDSWEHLSEAHRKRLKAHLRLAVDQPATLASLKKKLVPLPEEHKHSIVRFLVHLTQADGEVTPDEVRFLERVYKMIGLEAQQVYSDLHVQAATVTPATVSSQPVKAVQSVSKSTGFTLDAERIAQLQKETEAVSALLANVFTEEMPPEPVVEDAAEPESGVLGLDSDYSAFLRRLVSQHVWSRDELADMAADMELMLDGALEHINEIVLDLFDAPLAEGDDPVEINQELLEKLPI